MAPLRLAGMIVLALGFAQHAAAAESQPPRRDRFALYLGTYLMSSDTTVRADSIDGLQLGTSLNLEDTFGFTEETLFRVEGAWRFLDRHKLRMMYFDSNRTSRASGEQEIRFAGETFPIGLDITAEFDFDIFELAYEYDFLQRDRYELGASIGIHRVNLLTRLTATVSEGDSELSGTLRGEVTTNAPLPVIGLRGHWNLVSNLYLEGHAQYFQLAYEEYDGSIQDYQVGLLWQFSQHFGVGVSYDVFRTEVDVDEGSDFQGHLDWEYEGAQLYLRAAF